MMSRNQSSVEEFSKNLWRKSSLVPEGNGRQSSDSGHQSFVPETTAEQGFLQRKSQQSQHVAARSLDHLPADMLRQVREHNAQVPDPYEVKNATSFKEVSHRIGMNGSRLFHWRLTVSKLWSVFKV